MSVDISQSPAGSPNRIMHDLGYTKRHEVSVWGGQVHVYERDGETLRFGNVEDFWDYFDQEAAHAPTP